MKKILIVLLLIITSQSFAQINDDLVAIGKAYNGGGKDDSVAKSLEKYADGELKFTANFIRQLKIGDYKPIFKNWLMRPSDKDLKLIYIVEQVNFNTFSKSPKNYGQLVDSLQKRDIPTGELLHTYYEMAFCAFDLSRKFNLSDVNFDLDSYNLRDEGEKAIFFLESMQFYGTLIWGYMNIPKPPKFDKALAYINNYPQYNGKAYCRYINFDFQDFEIELNNSRVSYKKEYINKFYNTLMYNYFCLKSTKGGDSGIEELVANSILVKKQYYQFSKEQEFLEKYFSK
jgi:hypothetical protein